MKPNLVTLGLIKVTMLSGLSAIAGTRLCYVQAEDSDKVFKTALAQQTISTDEVSPVLLFEEGNYRYTIQSQEDGRVNVAMFDKLDENTLVMASANGNDGLLLINRGQKRLIACSAVKN